MTGRMRSLFVYLFVLSSLDAALISQSAIKRCEKNDNNEPVTNDGKVCKKKFVVAMTLKGGQGEVESLYANIGQAYQMGEKELSNLKKPFRLEISKSEVIASYRAYYMNSANASPYEIETIRYARKSISHSIYNCKDSWTDERTSCGKQTEANSDSLVWDSQGFCCKCVLAQTVAVPRANATCLKGYSLNLKALGYYMAPDGRKYDYSDSAHCMEMHDLWYDVFELDPPMLQYNITLRLLEFNGVYDDAETGTSSANWTSVGEFQLNPSKPLGRSPNGRVIAELQGDLLGSHGPQDFTTKYLLIPSVKTWPNESYPVQYTNGPGDWMLVDEHLVDLSGFECNKVGASYSAFRRQPGKCEKLPNSCFSNQPLQFWEHDDLLRQQDRPGQYMVHNFGQIHASSHPNNHSFILRFIHEDLHNSFAVFRIDASDILFVVNTGKARIVDTFAEDFEAMGEVGHLTVEVQNTGEIGAQFSISVAQCSGHHNLPAKTVTINPAQTVNVTFKLQSFHAKGQYVVCEVQLFDSGYSLIQTAKVDFNVESTCFCYGACGCTCEGSSSNSGGLLEGLSCPQPPPVIIEGGPIAVRILLLFLSTIGAEGIIGSIGGILLLLGGIKLMFGRVCFCRRTKEQQFMAELKKRGGRSKGPILVKCSGECRGALAAQDRYKRKVIKMKRMGKDPRMLDDWRNTSFICNCRDELTDIRFVNVIKSLCFFYYCVLLPFIWLGHKIWWSVFKDTAEQKQKARKAVLNAAKKKGNMEKYGVIDLAAEIKKEGTTKPQQNSTQTNTTTAATTQPNTVKKTGATKEQSVNKQKIEVKGKQQNTDKQRRKAAEKLLAEAKKERLSGGDGKELTQQNIGEKRLRTTPALSKEKKVTNTLKEGKSAKITGKMKPQTTAKKVESTKKTPVVEGLRPASKNKSQRATQNKRHNGNDPKVNKQSLRKRKDKENVKVKINVNIKEKKAKEKNKLQQRLKKISKKLRRRKTAEKPSRPTKPPKTSALSSRGQTRETQRTSQRGDSRERSESRTRSPRPSSKARSGDRGRSQRSTSRGRTEKKGRSQRSASRGREDSRGRSDSKGRTDSRGRRQRSASGGRPESKRCKRDKTTSRSKGRSGSKRRSKQKDSGRKSRKQHSSSSGSNEASNTDKKCKTSVDSHSHDSDDTESSHCSEEESEHTTSSGSEDSHSEDHSGDEQTSHSEDSSENSHSEDEHTSDSDEDTHSEDEAESGSEDDSESETDNSESDSETENSDSEASESEDSTGSESSESESSDSESESSTENSEQTQSTESYSVSSEMPPSISSDSYS